MAGSRKERSDSEDLVAGGNRFKINHPELLLDNTLQGRWCEAHLFDHFDHFLQQYIGVLFCKIFTFLLKKGVQKWVPKNAPIVR